VKHPLALCIPLALASGCAHHRATADLLGPRRDRVDLYKAWPQGDKLYVEVDLGDGTPRMMLLDSGAGVSLITPDVAAELGVVLSDQVDQYVQVSGLLEARSGVMPEVRIGRYRVRNVKVAVPLQPVHDDAGVVPMAGLLGSNVLSHFQVMVDYPANQLQLARQPVVELPPTAAPLYFDGQHAMTGAVLVAGEGADTVEEEILVDIDTGARGLWLFGAVSDKLAALASQGMEPVVGVSSSEGLPLRAALRPTRRIPLQAVRAGGTVVERQLDATWPVLGDGTEDLQATSPGLLGHAVLDGYRAVLDYPAQRFALLPADAVKPENDVHDWQLRQLRHSGDADRLVRMAEVQTWLGDLDDARSSLERHHRRHPDDPEGAVMLARVMRFDSDAAGALALLVDLAPGDLVDQGEAVAVANGLVLDGRTDDALNLATQASIDRPDDPQGWLALADVRRAIGDLDGARAALVRANVAGDNPDGALLRRAMLAWTEGDRQGAFTHLRRHLDLTSSAAVAPWFYGLLVESEEDREMLHTDLDRALSRLHPGEGALDFLAAGYLRAGDTETARRLMEQGMARDCPQASDDAQRDNCTAWYHALLGVDLDDARARIERALVTHPHRAEYLDTLGVVLEAQGDLSGASAAAAEAAFLTPDDIYLRWQAERLRKAAEDTGGPPAAGS